MMDIRSVFLARFVSSLTDKIPQFAFLSHSDRERIRDKAVEEYFASKNKTPPRNRSDATRDPYFGIKTCGRRGAAARLTMQMEAFEKTPIGERNARGRKLVNPFSLDSRRKAFDAAMVDLRKTFPNASTERLRKIAQSSARRVPSC